MVMKSAAFSAEKCCWKVLLKSAAENTAESAERDPHNNLIQW